MSILAVALANAHLLPCFEHVRDGREAAVVVEVALARIANDDVCAAHAQTDDAR